jgi:hypothetical protein
MVQGTGATFAPGKKAVIDWDGYTLGYYGRPFEARNKSKGGAFTGGVAEGWHFSPTLLLKCYFIKLKNTVQTVWSPCNQSDTPHGRGVTTLFTGEDKDFIRFTVDDPKIIPAFREAIVGVGGVSTVVYLSPAFAYMKNM